MTQETPLLFTIDSLTKYGIAGWAIDRLARLIVVEVFSDGELLLRTNVDRARPDVAAVYPNEPNCLQSGFDTRFELKPGHHELKVFLVAGTQRNLVHTEVLHCTDAGAVDSANEPAGRMNKPFPSSVIRAAEKLWNFESGDLTTEVAQMEFVERLIWLSQSAEMQRLPALIRYFRYLRETWAHCQFVEQFFPTRDSKRSETDKDVSCKQSSSAEMMAIIHQLYLLREEGVSGAFAEFGCFKGFSTCKLSFACDRLKIPMLVFDSFEGLPESDDVFYRRGDFAGGLEEVSSNVNQFGSPDCVTYHKGFFAESLSRVEVPPLMSLFMDVDLFSSSQDVTKVFDKVDLRGTIFSHECAPRSFADGYVIRSEGYGGDVISPIIDSFAARRLPLRGRHVADDTGAFWVDQTAIPVAFIAPVMHLASKAWTQAS